MFEHCCAASQITIVKGNNGFLFQEATKYFSSGIKIPIRVNENILEQNLELGKSQSETIKSKGKRDSYGKIKGRDKGPIKLDQKFSFSNFGVSILVLNLNLETQDLTPPEIWVRT